jgi:hypothetical protein
MCEAVENLGRALKDGGWLTVLMAPVVRPRGWIAARLAIAEDMMTAKVINAATSGPPGEKHELFEQLSLRPRPRARDSESSCRVNVPT